MRRHARRRGRRKLRPRLIKMATAGIVGSKRSSQGSCSICLEPYSRREREPKLLPCFHTFCRVCLSQIIDKARAEFAERQKVVANAGDADAEAGTEDIFLTCPSCRTPIQVPPEGVKKFQTNFYLERGEEGPIQPLICDLCEQGQVASHCCGQCQMKLCFHCLPVHGDCRQAAASSSPAGGGGEDVTQLLGVGKEQVEAISELLSRFGEEEKELHQQRKLVEDDLHQLYTTALERLVDARDDVLRKIRSHTEKSEEKLKSEMADMQRRRDALLQFTSRSEDSSLTGGPPQLKTALMSESELRKVRARARQRPVPFFKLDRGDRSSPAVLVNSLRKVVFGTLQLSPASPEDVPHAVRDGDIDPNLLFGSGTAPSSSQGQATRHQQRHAESPELSSRVDDLAQKLEVTLTRIKESESRVREGESREKRLQAEMKHLTGELNAFKDKNSFLIQDMTTMQEENMKLREDVSALQRHQQSHSQHSFATPHADAPATTGVSSSQQSAPSTEDGASRAPNAAVQGMSSETSLQVQQLQQDVGSVRISLKKAVDRVTSLEQDRYKVDNLENNVDFLKRSLDAFRPIYFRAELDRRVTTNSVHPLVLRDVEENEGGGYNPDNGSFFAPVNGTYQFHVTAAPYHDDRMAQLEILLCGDVVGCVYCEKVNSSSSTHCIVYMQAGAYLWLRTFPHTSSFDKDGMTSFSGALLMPDL